MLLLHESSEIVTKKLRGIISAIMMIHDYFEVISRMFQMSIKVVSKVHTGSFK